jgi:hypothetical protein
MERNRRLFGVDSQPNYKSKPNLNLSKLAGDHSLLQDLPSQNLPMIYSVTLSA